MTHTMRTLSVVALSLMVAVALVACGEPEPEDPDPVEPQATGAFAITVDLEGDAPEQEMLDLSGNPECQEDEVPDQRVVQNPNGTLRYAVVAVKEAPSGLPNRTTETPFVDQVQCMYTPRVVTARTGQTVEVGDSDPQLHNVRATRNGEGIFNISTFEGDVEEVSFDRAGVYSLVCDVHPWMQGWVYVTRHGQAGVTGEDGQVHLDELPVGDYVLEIWHEEYGVQEIEVTVEEDETTEQTVTITG